jgi:hypothetical protein
MPHVRWREPAAFKRAVRGRPGRWRARLPVSLFVAAVVLIARALVEAPHAPGWPLMIVIAVGCGLMLGLGLPALTLGFPSEIIVSPKGINRNGIEGSSFTIEFWPWERIAACTVKSLVSANGRSFPALVLHDSAGAVIGSIGLSARPPVSELEQYLAERGKPLGRRIASTL